MAGYLTARQTSEMQAAILDYLASNSEFRESAAAFEREAQLPAESSGREKGLLAKKWTSVLRLSKQVQELEKRLEVAERAAAEAPTLQPGAGHGTRGAGGRMLPVAPSAAQLKGHRGDSIHCVRAHPTFGIVASAGDDSSVKVWDAESGKLEVSLRGHTKAVHCLSFEPTGAWLASGGADLAIKLWACKDHWACTRTLSGHEHTISGLTWAASGDQVISCSRDESLKVWDAQSGYCVKTEGLEDWVRAVATSPDGTWLACGGTSTSVKLWSIGAIAGSWNPPTTLEHHEHIVQALAFSAGPVETSEVTSAEAGGSDTKALLLASAGRDNTVCVWHVTRGCLLFTLEGHTNWINDLRWHPDGRHLFTCADDRAVKVWDVRKRRCLRSLDEAHGHFVTSLDLAPGIGRLVSSGRDMEVRLWDCR